MVRLVHLVVMNGICGMALLTLALIMIYFSSLNWIGKLLLVLSSLSLAIILNV